MERIVYTGFRNVDHLENPDTKCPDPALVNAVERALAGLSPLERDIIIQRVYNGRPMPDIARQNNISYRQAHSLFYDARRRLRTLLADFVRERWGIETSGICRICFHPEKNKIESLLKSRSSRESWRKFNNRLEKAIGEKINPPIILINHLKHIPITKPREEIDENQ